MTAPWKKAGAGGKRKPDSKSAQNEWKVYKSENSLQAIERAL
jgi:hypothetical protein